MCNHLVTYLNVSMNQVINDPFHAIADPNRREILKLLSKQNMPINALAENFDMSRPAVSKHVKILWAAGLVSIEDVGRNRYCKLKEEGFTELQKWMTYYDQFWNSKLNALGKFLAEKNSKRKSKKS